MNNKSVLFSLLTALFLFGCGIPEEQYNAKVLEANKCKEDLSAAADSNNKMQEEIALLRSENQTLANRLSDLGENVQKLLGEKGVLATDLAETREREARLRKEQEAQRQRMAKYRKVIEKFQSLVSSGKLKIRIVRGRMVVEMASNILFPSGKAKLHEEGEAALSELAVILKTINDRDLQVAGHTDNVPIHTGKFKSNWELSTERAVTVVKFLQETGGVDPIHLSASGYAEYSPAATNDTEEGKAQNRRIEIVLMPNLDELPDMSELEGELDKTQPKVKRQ
jgi:chemotaxis protein MotB